MYGRRTRNKACKNIQVMYGNPGKFGIYDRNSYVKHYTENMIVLNASKDKDILIDFPYKKQPVESDNDSLRKSDKLLIEKMNNKLGQIDVRKSSGVLLFSGHYSKTFFNKNGEMDKTKDSKGNYKYYSNPDSKRPNGYENDEWIIELYPDGGGKIWGIVDNMKWKMNNKNVGEFTPGVWTKTNFKDVFGQNLGSTSSILVKKGRGQVHLYDDFNFISDPIPEGEKFTFNNAQQQRQYTFSEWNTEHMTDSWGSNIEAIKIDGSCKVNLFDTEDNFKNNLPSLKFDDNRTSSTIIYNNGQWGNLYNISIEPSSEFCNNKLNVTKQYCIDTKRNTSQYKENVKSYCLDGCKNDDMMDVCRIKDKFCLANIINEDNPNGIIPKSDYDKSVSTFCSVPNKTDRQDFCGCFNTYTDDIFKKLQEQSRKVNASVPTACANSCMNNTSAYIPTSIKAQPCSQNLCLQNLEIDANNIGSLTAEDLSQSCEHNNVTTTDSDSGTSPNNGSLDDDNNDNSDEDNSNNSDDSSSNIVVESTVTKTNYNGIYIIGFTLFFMFLILILIKKRK